MKCNFFNVTTGSHCTYDSGDRLATKLDKAYQQGKADGIDEMIAENKKLMDMLLNAMNSIGENKKLHIALAETRANEYRVRCELNTFLEQMKRGE